jgi:hypothetical protein
LTNPLFAESAIAAIAKPESARSSVMTRPQKITLGEMRQSGPTRLLIYCQDYRCSHSVTIDASQWPDDVRLSDLEPKLICRACGHRGADVRPLFAVDKPASRYPAH